MFERFKRNDDRSGTATGPGAVSAGTVDREGERETLRGREATAVHDRDAAADDGARFRRADERTFAGPAPRTRDRDRVAGRDERRGVDRGDGVAPGVHRDTMAAVRERQRDRFGGFSWGSDFFGFLSALGLASILTGVLTGAGVAFNLFDQATGSDASSGDAKTIGLGGGIALLLVLAVAWYAGGYVAGRMARFDGGRQGVGVWLWTILVVVVLAVLGAIGGSKYDVFGQLNLPSVPVDGNTLTGAGAAAGVAALLVTLLAAVLGGKVGERFHRKVDRVALHDRA
jgi:hypothetical protein